MYKDRKITFVSHNTVDFIDDLKLVSLYYDKVIIPSDEVFFAGRFSKSGGMKEGTPFLSFDAMFSDDHYRSVIRILEKEGVVDVRLDVLDYVDINHPNLLGHKDDNFGQTLLNNYYLFFEPGAKAIIKEVNKSKRISFEGSKQIAEVECLERTFKSISENNHKLRGNAPLYFITQLRRIVSYLSKGETAITTSDLLHELVKKYLTSFQTSPAFGELRSSSYNLPAIAVELLRINLPNISRLAIEDILEVKFRLKDELSGFNQKMNELEYDVGKIDIAQFDASQYVNKFIIPRVVDLQNKMKGLDKALGIKIINELKNPYSYSPLLLSFTNIPQGLLLMASLGLISASSVLEYIKNKEEVRNNGLYYLLKLRRL